MALRKLLLILLLSGTAKAQTPMHWLTKKAGSTPDPDSIAFVARVLSNGGSLSSTEKTAIGQLIRDLKAYSLWAKCVAIYPLVGSSEAAAKVNMKNPTVYELTFYNSPTINGSGVDWNGTTQYANTGYTTDLFSTSDNHISYYAFENVSQAGIPMGGVDMDIELYSGVYYSFNLTGGSNYATFTPSSINSWFLNTRQASGSFKGYEDGSVGNTKTASSSAGSGYDIFIGARAGGGNIPGFYSTIGCGFASIGAGMDGTDASNFYTALTTFLTTLSR